MTSLAPATPAKQGARSARQRILALAPVVPPAELYRRRGAGEPALPYNLRRYVFGMWVELAASRDTLVRLTETAVRRGADFDLGRQQRYHDQLSGQVQGLDRLLDACRHRLPLLSGERAALMLELQTAATRVRRAIDG